MKEYRSISEITPLYEKELFYVVERHKSEFTYPLHSHREYELNFIENGTGAIRIVGDSVERIGEHELVLVGGVDLAHTWEQGECTSESIREITIQFSPEMFSQSLFGCSHFNSILRMLEDVPLGIVFPPKAIMKVYSLLEEVSSNENGFYKALGFLRVLYELSVSEESRTLVTPLGESSADGLDMLRVSKIKEYINEHYREDIKLTDVAQLADMSSAAFSRFFKLRTGKTFSDYLIDIRIACASRLLIDTSKSITEVCFESGFNNLSNFNRIFKRKKNSTPKEFRSHYRRNRFAM